MAAQTISNKLRAWLPLLPLALLLLASYWLSMQVLPLSPVASEQRHDVDYVIDKLTTTTLNELGQPRVTLAAEKLWHYPDDDTTHLQMPHMTSFYADRPPSIIKAQTGKLSNKTDDVFLYDDVQILRPANGSLGEQQFRTNYLHVAPDRDWADTDHPVVMLGRKSTISAVGMELDNQARTVKLLSRVNATHEPIPD
jgi:lipopolysaccharide export system protein LptC